MADMNIKIGDHLVRIICHSKKFDRFFLKNYQLLKENNGQTPDLLIDINAGFGTAFQNYHVKTQKEAHRILFQRADYQITIDSDYNQAAILAHDEFALKHALVNLYSSFIVHHQWGLLIHSSCAVERGGAHIFAGQSGAGKSTVAHLSYPRSLLSDEASLVKVQGNEVWVFQSPFRSEINAESHAYDPVELLSVQLLKQAKQNDRILLAKSDAVLHLMDKVFFWPATQDELPVIMRLLTEMVTTVPVYELSFQKDNTFWELIS